MCVLLILALPLCNAVNLKFKLHLAAIVDALGYPYGTVVNLLIALILLFSVFGPRGIWFKFLNLKIMNRIGILSYSLYLWQQLFTIKTKYFINTFPFSMIFLVIAALFSYYFIERPFLRLRSNYSFTRLPAEAA